MAHPKLSLELPRNTSSLGAIFAPRSGPPSPETPDSSADSITDRIPARADGFVWAAPDPDPRYWEHVARAQKIRRTVTEMKQNLAQKQPASEEAQQLSRELRARERRLMRLVDHYVLDYDDVIEADRAAMETALKAGSGLAMGTITPPVSPEMPPSCPLPQLPQPPQLPRPKQSQEQPAAQYATGLDSQGCINSYKRHEQYVRSAGIGDSDGRDRPAARPWWPGLFAARGVRPVAPPGPLAS